MPPKITHEQFVEQLKIIKPHLVVLSQYNGNKKYITVKCTIHNYTWESKPNWLVCKNEINDCQMCYNERRGNTIRLTRDKFIENAILVHGDKYDYSKVEYTHSKLPVCIICPIHGEFWQMPNKHTNEKHGCPECSKIKSKIEVFIGKILTDNKIEYIEQKKFRWLGRQSLDFYLPDYKIAIECQGEQHFESHMEHFGGKTGFIKNVGRDIKKNKLCKDNKVDLIYVTNKIEFTKYMMITPMFENIYNEKNTICTTNENIPELLLKQILK